MVYKQIINKRLIHQEINETQIMKQQIPGINDMGI